MYKCKKKEQANTKKYNITTKQEKDLCADPKCIHKKDKKNERNAMEDRKRET